MEHLAAHQPADRLQADVWMWPHPHAGRAGEVVRTVRVEEAPGADHPPPPVGQRPGDRHATRPAERDGGAIHQLDGPAFGPDGRIRLQVAHPCTLSRESGRRRRPGRGHRDTAGPVEILRNVTIDGYVLTHPVPGWGRWRRAREPPA